MWAGRETSAFQELHRLLGRGGGGEAGDRSESDSEKWARVSSLEVPGPP